MANNRNKRGRYYDGKQKSGFTRSKTRTPVEESGDSSSVQNESIKKGSKCKWPQDSNVTAKFNDVSWYSKNDQMLRDAASFSYNRPLGSYFPVEDIAIDPQWTSALPIVTHQAHSPGRNAVPGVMALVTGICPGLSRDYNSPINLAAQNIYSFVRYNNSGAANYDPEDLMLYMFALDSAYACWNFLKRAYGVARAFNQNNWYMPKTIIEAMGIDYYDLTANLADFRLFLNTTAARLSSFCVPSVMPIFVRHSWMFSNIWADASQRKAQLYEFVPLYFYQYSEASNPKGGELVAKPWGSWNSESDMFPSHVKPVLNSVLYIKGYMNSLLDVLYKSEDIGNMSGDILKAYGQANLFKVTPVPEDYMVEPVYNEEVLNQIHNATVLNNSFHNGGMAAGSTSVFNITQDPDSQIIKWDPTFASSPTNKTGTLLNMPWTDVTPANTMVGSRLACSYVSTEAEVSVDDTNPFATSAKFGAVGTEFIWNAYIAFTNSKLDTTMWYGFKTLEEDGFTAHFVPGTLNGVNSSWLRREEWEQVIQENFNVRATLSLLSNFDWHPWLSLEVAEIIKTMNSSGDVDHTDVWEHHYGIFGDLSNWTFVRELELENLHLTAIMSEFNIPQIGSF